MGTLDDDMQAALEAAGIGAFWWDKQTSRFSASPTLEGMLHEMCGSFDGTLESFLACLHAEDRDSAAQAFASAVEARDDYHAEIRALRRDGGVRTLVVHGRALIDDAGEPTGMTGVIQDVTATRDTEAAIRRSEARFRSLVLATSQTVWLTGPDGRVMEDSPSWREFTGQTFEEYQGLGWIDAIHPDDREQAWQRWLEASRARVPHENEFRARRHDGMYRHLLVRAAPVMGAEVHEWIGTTSDVTERKEEEQTRAQLMREISDKQRLLSAVLRHMPAGLVVVSGQAGVVQAVNDRFNAYLGMSAILGTRLTEEFRGTILNPDGTPRPRHAHPLVRSIVNGETVEDLETIFVRPDGQRTVLSVSSAPLREPQGGIEAAVGLYLDVTERSRLRDDLAEQRARLSAVLEAIPGGLIIAEAPGGNVSYANPYAVSLLRGSPVNVTELSTYRKHRAWTMSGEPLDPSDLPLVRALKRAEVSRAVELAFEVDGGDVVYLRCNAAPVRNDAGTITAGVCTFEDITREIEARQQREQNARFRELFMGMLGHDLRSPLASIMGSAALLPNQGALLPEQSHTVERISAASMRMKRMIDDLLDLTRSRLAGGIPIDPRETDVHTLAQRIVDELLAAHEDCAIHLAVSGDPMVHCDPDRMSQVLSNLLGNAIQHGPPGAPIHLTIARAGADLRIVVHNPGPPIPAHLLPAIFDPFRRASTSRENASGLGLGLYISQQIVAAHRGTIEVSSSDDAGTSFTVVVPAG